MPEIFIIIYMYVAVNVVHNFFRHSKMVYFFGKFISSVSIFCAPIFSFYHNKLNNVQFP